MKSTSRFALTYNQISKTTSSRREDGGAYCGAAFGGKCMVSKAKLAKQRREIILKLIVLEDDCSEKTF